ncbi:MAG: hypothetical protein PVI13_05170 [Desulfobacterales bacterium]|jgi:hypothetical protein
MNPKKSWIVFALMALAPLIWSVGPADAKTEKPNILLIMSDDVGIHNLSAYSMGLAGYKTPSKAAPQDARPDVTGPLVGGLFSVVVLLHP